MTAVAAVNNMGACAHNPRGNLWFNDETTYGHKLLMKMGWSKGKGLGKNEDGIKENLSVKFRSTNSGLGYRDDSYTNVMKSEYESILKSLKSNCSQKETCAGEKADGEEENKNSEQKSKVIKNRLRYPKLFFGKDVTKYSEKDMKSIFICSLPPKDKQENLKNSDLSQKQQSAIEFPKMNETYSSTLSISDYFSKKMKEKKNNILPGDTLNEPNQQQSSIDSEIAKTDSFSIMSKKSKRISETNGSKKSVNDIESQQIESKSEVVETANNLTAPFRKKSSKRKRKMSQVRIEEIDSSQINNTEIECLNYVKKKQKLSENLVYENNVSEIENFENGMSSKINSSLPDKKRRFGVYENENSSFQMLSNEGKISCQIQLSPDRALKLKKKRKKFHDKRKNISSDAKKITLEHFQTKNDHTSLISAEDSVKNNEAISFKKKKTKFKKLKSCLKSKTGNYSVKNVSFNGNVSYRVIDTDYEFVQCLSDEFGKGQNNFTNGEIDSIDGFESGSANHTLNVQVVNSCNTKDNNDLKAEVGERVLDEELNKGCSLSSLPLLKSSDSEVQDFVSDEVKDNCSLSSSSLSKSPNAEVQEIVLGKVKENYSLSSLPSPESTYYNSWIESQRQALKMKMYKSMLKSIKKHKVLKTSNILSLKGYGNWGFK